MTRSPGRRPGGDDGTIVLLTIGFAVVLLVLIYTVVSASAVYLARRDLAAAVDGSALAAAQELDADAYYAGASSDDLPLDGTRIGRAVDEYVARTYPGATNQRITGGVDPTGRSVEVRGERDVRLPVFGTVTVHAEATATNHRAPAGARPVG